NAPTSPNGVKTSTRLIAIYGPANVIPVDPAQRTTVAVGLLDSWGETIPDLEQSTTAAFGFNAPASRAPQAILLAVPPVENIPLSVPTLINILGETRQLAHARMAVPDNLSAAAAILPLMMVPATGMTAVALDPTP